MQERNSDFCRLCEMVYGGAWQAAFHRDTGISERSIRRWVAGDNEVSEVVLKKVIDKFVKEHCKIVVETINSTSPRPRQHYVATFKNENDYLAVMVDFEISYTCYMLMVDEISSRLRWHVEVIKRDIIPGDYFSWLKSRENIPLNRCKYLVEMP